MIVLRRNRGGAYILCELDGATWQARVAAFRLLPYFARHRIVLPENLKDLIDISMSTLDRLAETEDTGETELYKNKDWNFDGVKLKSGSELEDNEGAEEEIISDLEESEDEIISPAVATSRKSERIKSKQKV